MRRTTILPATLTAIALAAGCGDDDGDEQGLSKSEYIAKSSAICNASSKQADAAFKRLIQGQPKTPATAQRFVREGVVPIFGGSVSRRAKLPAPDGDEQRVAAINSAGHRALAGFERIAAEPSRSAALMLGRVRDPATGYDALSRRYGIADCGGDKS